MTIANKIQKVNDSITRLEHGKYCDVDINWITTQIDWLYKFRHIDYEQMSEFAERITNVIKDGMV